MMDVRLGLRNLFRNRWRSGLTLAAVGVAVALMVWSVGFIDGWLNEMIRSMTGLETLQVQVQTVEHVRNPRVYRTFELAPDQLDRVAALPGVIAVTRRAEAHGLVGTEQRSQVARLIGVDPVAEAAATPIADAVVAGRWLTAAVAGEAAAAATEPASLAAPAAAATEPASLAAPAAAATEPASPASPASPIDDADDAAWTPPIPAEVVLGQGLAYQLGVTVGDELVVFLEAADGSLGNDVLVIVGVVQTGNSMLDRGAVYLRLEDLQFLAALGDGVHRIAIRTGDLAAARTTAAAVAAVIGAAYPLPADGVAVAEEELAVLSWQEMTPTLEQMIQLVRGSYWFMYLLIYLVAAVGILNTQRMSALERRREFGVMMAIGMRPRRLFRTLLVETAVLGLAGAAIGALLGGALTWYHATAGLNLGMFSDGASFTYMGVTMSERLRFVLTTRTIVEPVVIMVGVAVISGLWPAIRAARTQPAPTIAGRT
jgi:ABC-type lipoprotein release transport system permease subunit